MAKPNIATKERNRAKELEKQSERRIKTEQRERERLTKWQRKLRRSFVL